jgi:adenylate cyclase
VSSDSRRDAAIADSGIRRALPPLAEGVLNPISLRFRSRELEEEYWASFQPRLRRRTLIAVAVVLVIYSAFGLLDRWIVPEIVIQAWRIRAGVLVLCIILMLLTRTRLFQKAHQPIILSLPILGGLGILILVAVAGETGRLLYYAGLILAIIWTMLYADLRFLIALGASVYLIAGYEIIALVVRPLPLPVVINNTFFLVGTLVMSAAAGYESRRAVRVNYYQSLAIERERQRSEALLLNILPREITEVLKTRSGTIAQRYPEASILFADIVGFTTLSAQMGAEEMVELLNETFSYFDSLVERYDLEKIRTIGDNYMVVAGVPRPCPDHAESLASMALGMQAYAAAPPSSGRSRPRLRIGISTGPVVAGVIGVKKFQFDVWGDAVNAASRMESQGLPGEIQVTRATYELIKDRFVCDPRGRIPVKGMGQMETWFLRGRREGSGESGRES